MLGQLDDGDEPAEFVKSRKWFHSHVAALVIAILLLIVAAATKRPLIAIVGFACLSLAAVAGLTGDRSVFVPRLHNRSLLDRGDEIDYEQGSLDGAKTTTSGQAALVFLLVAGAAGIVFTVGFLR